MKPVLVDTGFIVATLDRADRHHAQCLEVGDSLTAPLITCEAVIAESCHLLRHLHGAGERRVASREPRNQRNRLRALGAVANPRA